MACLPKQANLQRKVPLGCRFRDPPLVSPAQPDRDTDFLSRTPGRQLFLGMVLAWHCLAVAMTLVDNGPFRPILGASPHTRLLP